MMNTRGLATLVTIGLLASAFFASRAHAAELHHGRPNAAQCRIAIEFAAVVGEAEAERLARKAGATDAQIAAAKRCKQ